MNLSRAATLRLAPPQTVFSYGRVQTPTLTLVVRRDLAIESFKPRDFFEVAADVTSGPHRVVMRYSPKEEARRLWNKEGAERIAAQILGVQGPISVKRESRRKPPPKPYALSDLQGDANARLGLSAQETLDVAQSLYEQHKAITYPRADCNHLPEELVSEVGSILRHLNASGVIPQHEQLTRPLIRKSVFDSSKLSDHHAIVPTNIRPPIEAMSETERAVYRLIAVRFAQQLMPDYEFEATSMSLRAGQIPLSARGHTPRKLGWRSLRAGPPGGAQNAEDPTADDAGDEENAPQLPPIDNGAPGRVTAAQVESKRTEPPALIEPALTAAWEDLLEGVANGSRSRQEALAALTQYMRKQLAKLLSLAPAPTPTTAPRRLAAAPKSSIAPVPAEHSGNELTGEATFERPRVRTPPPGITAPKSCPACDKPMTWRVNSKNKGFFGCTGYPECRTTIDVETRASPQITGGVARALPSAPRPRVALARSR